MIAASEVAKRTIGDVPRALNCTIETDVYLGCPDAAPSGGPDFDGDVREAEAPGKSLQPSRVDADIEEGAQQHVTADAGGRVENRKTVVRHGLKYRLAGG
jgi:hypothetical protein